MFLMSKKLWNKCFGSLREDEIMSSQDFDFERFKKEYEQYKINIINNIKQRDYEFKYENDTFLEKMPYLKECYNKKQIKYIGNGSSRIVFAFSDGKALKCALAKTGVAQNRNEIKNIKYSSVQYKCFPTIYSHDNQNLYLITDCCRSLEDKDINSFFNLTFNEFIESLQIILNVIKKQKNKQQNLTAIDIIKISKKYFKSMIEQYINKYKKSTEKIIKNNEKSNKKSTIDYNTYKINIYNNLLSNKMLNFINLLLYDKSEYTKSIESIIQFYIDIGFNTMMFVDLYAIENWGILRKNNYDIPVIIDAGLSNYIAKKFY